MGLFGFIGNVASAAVKVAITPVAIVKDAVSVAVGGDVDSTKELIKSVGEDLEKSVDEAFGGEL